MRIHIAEHYGLCFGVRDAIKEAERLTEAGPLTILGELVHNPVVRERFAARGVKEGNLNSVGAAATSQVMITARRLARRGLWGCRWDVPVGATCTRSIAFAGGNGVPTNRDWPSRACGSARTNR